jgi:hypothetical protein
MIRVRTLVMHDKDSEDQRYDSESEYMPQDTFHEHLLRVGGLPTASNTACRNIVKGT